MNGSERVVECTSLVHSVLQAMTPLQGHPPSQYTGRGRKVVGYRSTKVYIKLDGWAVASVRVARGQENVLGGGVEFVVLLFSVVRHVDILICRDLHTWVWSVGRGAHA